MVVPLIVEGAEVAAGALGRRTAAGAASRAAAGQGVAEVEESEGAVASGRARRAQSSARGAQQQGKASVTYRVSTSQAVYLIGSALFVDGMQALSLFVITVLTAGIGAFMGFVVSIFLNMLSFIVFWLWFKRLGVSYFSGSRVGTKIGWIFGSFLLEMTPLGVFPGVTLGVASVINASWAEDREKKPVSSAAAKRVRLPQPANDRATNDN